MSQIVLVGAGGHARSIVDSILADGANEVVGFVDSKPCSYRGVTTVGDDSCLPKLYRSGVTHAFVCLGYLGVGDRRQQIALRLKQIGFELATIIDPAAVVASDASIGPGSFVGKQAVVNANATVGEMAIINTAAVVEHDCKVGGYAHVSVNATLCGGVCIGEAALIGAGAVVLQGINVGRGAIVGANATVLVDVDDGAKAVGVHNGR